MQEAEKKREDSFNETRSVSFKATPSGATQQSASPPSAETKPRKRRSVATPSDAERRMRTEGSRRIDPLQALAGKLGLPEDLIRSALTLLDERIDQKMAEHMRAATQSVAAQLLETLKSPEVGRQLMAAWLGRNPDVAQSATNPDVAQSATNPDVAQSAINPGVAQSATNPQGDTPQATQGDATQQISRTEGSQQISPWLQLAAQILSSMKGGGGFADKLKEYAELKAAAEAIASGGPSAKELMEVYRSGMLDTMRMLALMTRKKFPLEELEKTVRGVPHG